MVLEEWVPSEELDGMVVPIAEVRWEVVVAEQVARLHLPLLLMRSLHLQMVCSHLGMFWVVRAL